MQAASLFPTIPLKIMKYILLAFKFCSMAYREPQNMGAYNILVGTMHWNRVLALFSNKRVLVPK